MNVDKPALSTEGGGTAHIRGAEGTIILVLFVGFCLRRPLRLPKLLYNSRLPFAVSGTVNFGTINFIGRD